MTDAGITMGKNLSNSNGLENHSANEPRQLTHCSDYIESVIPSLKSGLIVASGAPDPKAVPAYSASREIGDSGWSLAKVNEPFRLSLCRRSFGASSAVGKAMCGGVAGYESNRNLGSGKRTPHQMPSLGNRVD